MKSRHQEIALYVLELFLSTLVPLPIEAAYFSV